MSELTMQLRAALIELSAPDGVVNAIGHIERALELADVEPDGPDAPRRMLGYLWTATGRNSRLPVSDLFDPDDPIVADVERLAIFPEKEPA